MSPCVTGRAQPVSISCRVNLCNWNDRVSKQTKPNRGCSSLELRLTPSSVESSAPLSKRKSDVNFPVLEIVGIVGRLSVLRRRESRERKKKKKKGKKREKWSERNTTQKKKEEEEKKKKKKKRNSEYIARGRNSE